MKTYKDLIRECLVTVPEILPWDVVARMEDNPELLILDVREPYEFNTMRIAGSINVPRGILESACEWDYEETIPNLVQAKHNEIVVACRSGFRSVLAVFQMQLLGYENVASLKTGLRGWSEYEQPLVKQSGEIVQDDDADLYFMPNVRLDQRRPKKI